MARKEVIEHIVLEDGSALQVRVMDGLVVDDLVIQGMKAEGYRIITNRDVFPTVGRKIKDYLIRLRVIAE